MSIDGSCRCGPMNVLNIRLSNLLKCLTQPSRTSVRTPGILSNIKRRVRPDSLGF